MSNQKPYKLDEFVNSSHKKELLQLNRLYATLSQINHAIVHIQKKSALLQEICDIAIKYGEFTMAWVGLIDDSHRFIRAVAFSGNEQGYIEGIRIPLDDTVLGGGPTGEAVNKGHCVFCQDIATDPRMEPWRMEALNCGYRASAAIPIRQNKQVIGAFMVYVAEKMVFDYKEKQLLEEIGNEISFALDMISREKQRKSASNALITSENRFRELLENIHLISILLDNQGNVTFCNPYLLELTGYTHKEMIGSNWFELMIPSTHQKKIKEILENSKKGEMVNHSENPILIKNGELRTIRWHNTILLNAKGKVEGVASIGEDITEKKKKEAELISAKEKAEENDKLKTAFLHNITHEIRTPMNAIAGFSEFLCDPNLSPEKIHRYSGIINKSSHQLLSIITDIINMATIESGQAKIKEKDFKLNSVLETIYDQFNVLAKLKQINLTLKLSLPDYDDMIFSDETKITQILTNLVGNALKFTNFGSVHFGYKTKDTEIEFFVEDSGIGILDEMHEEIFKRFSQVENSSELQAGGTGLGLAIAKSYVKLLGGKMWLSSQPDKGSTFYFTIPVKKVKGYQL